MATKVNTEVILNPARLAGAVSYGLCGIYFAILILAFISSKIGDIATSTPRQYLLRIVWVTASLVIFRQIFVTLLIRYYLCMAELSHPRRFLCGTNNPDQLSPIQLYRLEKLYRTVPEMVNVFVPPVVASLSDGILGWRLYVVWNRPIWLRFSVVVALSATCALGLAGAVLMLPGIDTKVHLLDPARLYQIWAWVSFILNSMMTGGILIRIRHLGDMRRPDLQRYATVWQALIESAVISWIATLGSALAWKVRPAFNERYSKETDFPGGKGKYPGSSALLFALPILLGISQVLIVTRVHMSKVDFIEDLTSTMTAVAGDELQDHEGTTQIGEYGGIEMSHMRSRGTSTVISTS